MKTFIWNTEYEVMAAVAETEDVARLLIYMHFVKTKQEELLDPGDEIVDGKVPSYALERAKYLIRTEIAKLLEVYKRPADIVLEEKSAIIYNHANE